MFGNPKFSIKNKQEDNVVPPEAERTMERNYPVGEISHAEIGLSGPLFFVISVSL